MSSRRLSGILYAALFAFAHEGALGLFEDGVTFDFPSNREFQIEFNTAFYKSYNGGVADLVKSYLPSILEQSALGTMTLQMDQATDEITEYLYFDTPDGFLSKMQYDLKLINSITHGTSTLTFKKNNADPLLAFTLPMEARSSDYKFKLKNEMDVHSSYSKYARSLKLDDPKHFSFNTSVTSVDFLHTYFNHVKQVFPDDTQPLNAIKHFGRRIYDVPAKFQLASESLAFASNKADSIGLDVVVSVDYPTVAEAMLGATQPTKVEFSFNLKYHDLTKQVSNVSDYPLWVEAAYEIRDLVQAKYPGYDPEAPQ